MAKSKTEIINDIQSLMARKGGKSSDWYVGQAADPKGELAKHGFRKGDVGAIRTAATEMQAHDVVEYFVGSIRTQGEVENVVPKTFHVYVYQTTIDGARWYGVLYREYASYSEARDALSLLPRELARHRPFIRNVRDVAALG